MYAFNIAKTVFFSLVVPLAVVKKITWPAAVSKLFVKNSGKAVGGFLSKEIIGGVTMKTAASAGLVGLDAAISLPPDLKGLYLSVADYERLLNDYERDIRRTKNSLIQQKKTLLNKQGR